VKSFAARDCLLAGGNFVSLEDRSWPGATD